MRLAECLCLRQTLASSSRMESTNGLYGSSLEGRRYALGTVGEKSSIARHLRIVGCETPVRRCISALETPFRDMSLILSINGMLIILPASVRPSVGGCGRNGRPSWSACLCHS